MSSRTANRDGLVHNWRVSQLTRLGVPASLAELYADRGGWHQVAGWSSAVARPGSPCASSDDRPRRRLHPRFRDRRR